MSLSRISLFKSIDSSLGSLICKLLGSVNYLIDGKNNHAPLDSEKIRSILLIRPGGMGDMIILLPVIRTLNDRFPEASIKIICEKRNMEVLKLAGMDDYAFVYDINPLKFLWKLFKTEFDVAIDTEQFHHFSAVFAILSGATTRIGFKINPRRNPLYTHLINYAPDGSEGEQFMKLLAPLPITTADYKLEGFLSDNASFNTTLVGSPKTRTYAVIHMGTSNPYKLWHTDKYIELTKILHENHKLSSVLIGDKRDKRISEQVIAATRSSSVNTVSFAGKLNLYDTCKLIRNACIFIGTDSGLAHLAIALSVPTVVMFGPSDHLKWGLCDNRHAVVKRDLPCAPCFIFGYHKPCKTIACMRNISVEDVSGTCANILNQESA